jgi:hypothetical protein
MANILIHGDTTFGGALIHRDSLTGFPVSPKPYMQVIKDGVPYSYVDMSGGQGTLYSWLPMANKPNTYLHQQGIAATEITVQHNMGTDHVGIFVYDVDNGMVLANFDIVNANQIVVHLSEAILCNIIVFGYNVIGAATIAGSTVQVGSIELTASVNGNLLVNGQALATNDRVDAVLALAPEEFDTFKEVADNLALKADASSVYIFTLSATNGCELPDR